MTEFTLQKRAAPAQGPAHTPAVARPTAAPPRASGLAAKADGLDQAPQVAALQAARDGLDSAPRGHLPPQLKAGIERLSGRSMEGVKVHYNSSHPSSLGALAFARGGEIHLAPGQEAHLPHEAWHVAQQAQGRVSPTAQLKAGAGLNDDPALEREADVMGARAASIGPAEGPGLQSTPAPGAGGGVVQAMLRRGLTTGRRFASSLLRSSSTLAPPPVFGSGGMEEERQQAPPPPPPAVYRADNFPFHTHQPSFGPGMGTPKSAVGPDSVVSPVDEEGDTTLAQHVHGEPQDKAKSPFTSGSSSLDSVNLYGKNLLEMFPGAGQVHGQDQIQQDISNSTDPRFANPAFNKDKTRWSPPSDAHRAAAQGLGLDPDSDKLSFRDRAKINSATDKEALVAGKVPAQLWKFVSGAHLMSGVPFGVGPGKINLAKLGAAQGRDPRTMHPEGFRIPVDDHGMEFLARKAHAQSQQAEVDRERKEDEDVRSGRVTEAQLAAAPPPPALGFAPPVRRGRGGASPGREKQYEQLMERLRKKVNKPK